jgi:hypothetical protein
MMAMKTKKLVPALLALLSFSCQTGGDLQPIVIDLSAARTPAPSATPSPLPKATPAPTAVPAVPAVPAAAPAPVPSPAPAPVVTLPDSSAKRTPRSVAQSRVEAYNQRDLDALASLYAPDARVYDPPDRLRDSGIEQIRQAYARRFASTARSTLSVGQRMTEGNFVVDHETETADAGRVESSVVISEIRDGRIVRVWVLR